MKQLEIIKQVLPVIDINFDEVKASLNEKLSQYENIVVTEETLPDCKEMQKELSSVRRGLDGMRLDIQREVKKPLDHFNNQMKELFGMVVAIEDPIKKGISVFEDKRIEEKTNDVLAEMTTLIGASGLREKFSDQLEMDKKWLNKGATMKSITDEIDGKLKELLRIQDVEDDAIKSINVAVKSASAGLVTPLEADKYISRVTERGQTFAQVFEAIQGDSEAQLKAESAAVEKSEVEKTEIIPAQKPSESSDEQTPKTRTVSIRVTTTEDKIAMLSNFLKENSIGFEKIG